MNRLVGATLELETRRRDLGTLMDIPEESRAEGHDAKIETAMAAVKSAQETVITASHAEPERRETTTTNEGREILELRNKSSIAGFVTMMAAQKNEGPEAEFRAAVLGDGAQVNHLPIDMLLTVGEYRRFNLPAEERAVTAVAASARTEGNQDSIAGRVFQRSVPAYLGIPMPSVAAGVQGYPRLTGGPTFSVQALSGEQAAVAGTFAGNELGPIRGTGSYEFRVEDVSRLIGIEETMRVDLRNGIDNLLNHQAVNGSGTAPNVSGVIHAVGATPSTNPTNADDFSEISARILGEVDGLGAYGPMDLRLVMRSDIYTHLAATFATNDDSVSAYDHLSARVGSIQVNNTIPAKSNNDIGHVIIAKTGFPERSAVMPVWRNLEIIVDPYTLAQKGEVRLTAVVQFNFAVLDSDAFAVKKIRTS